MSTTLDKLKIASKAKVLKISTELNKRITEMGLTTGAAVEIIKIAPLGDPIEIKVRGYNLSVRKEDAAKITVEEQL